MAEIVLGRGGGVRRGQPWDELDAEALARLGSSVLTGMGRAQGAGMDATAAVVPGDVDQRLGRVQEHLEAAVEEIAELRARLCVVRSAPGRDAV